MPRFYCPVTLTPGQTVDLPGAVTRHALGALRLRDGENVILFNGDGRDYRGVLQQDGKRATVRLIDVDTPQRESPLAVQLVQGISSGDRMDITLQKAVELGVSAIQPVSMRRSVVRLAGEKKERRRAHWQGIVIAACEQCGRSRIPEVATITEYPEWLKASAGPTGSSNALRLLLDPQGTTTLHDLPPPKSGITLLAGPEGGFDPGERAAALQAGFIGVRLGPRVLRTETAALAALAALQTLWGDFLK